MGLDILHYTAFLCHCVEAELTVARKGKKNRVATRIEKEFLI